MCAGAEQVAEQVDEYVKNSYQIVAIVGVECSPSYAVEALPVTKNNDGSQGIFIQELLEELRSRGLDNISMIGAYISKTMIESTCKRLEKVIPK